MTLKKPSCVGERFGWLTVLAEDTETTKDANGRCRRKWTLECKCGKIIRLNRGDFDPGKTTTAKQVSCGCFKRSKEFDNTKRPKDLTGQKFGSLTCINVLPERTENRKVVWNCLCDCGNYCSITTHHISRGYRLNCGSDAHQHGLVYPSTPSPYPSDASAIVEKWLFVATAKHRTKNINSDIEDERMERLIRSAWIITYRRWQGEDISDLHEKRYIWKYLRHAKEAIKARVARQRLPIRRYTRNDAKKEIGSEMTNLTFPDYPINQTLETETLPKKRRFKFKTC